MTGGDDEGRPPGEDRTVFSQSPAIPPADSPRPAGAGKTGEARQIRVGDVLNHIFEVRRFIARGGMGEVFEGINVNTDERVAIKVILPHLAADSTVQAMFRKEARTLTRLSHPGLVQYRVLAQEPELGAFYIVTEYIDGPNLSDRLGNLNATPPQIARLLRRLAEGLKAAHALDAVHRDVSPDNVMLEGGELDRAKIIDFGIAKDLSAAGQTIVGDGFAGKLNYVAPEQLGDFDREVGPWSDVYSLGLTTMAVVLGRDVKMGATLVEAVDRRRAGVDLSEAPEPLRPVLERMLKADPAERLRSMDAVLEMLDSPALAAMAKPAALAEDGKRNAGARATIGERLNAAWNRAGLSKTHAIVATVGLAFVILGVVAFTFWPDDRKAAVATDRPAEEQVARAPPADPVTAARKAVDAELPTMPCSWLELADVKADGNAVSLTLRGVSGRSAEALDRMERLLKRAGLRAASIDFSDVSPIRANTCRPIEAFAQLRAGGAGRLSVKQSKFEMSILPSSAGPDAGKLGAQAVFTLDLAGLSDDMTFVGIDEAGEMVQLARNKSELTRFSEPLGEERYRFNLITTHSGWSGILMLTGGGPFPADLLTSSSSSRSGDWADKFLELAKQRNWKSEMVWYRTVDEAAN